MNVAQSNALAQWWSAHPGRRALIPFWPCGYPDVAATLAWMRMAVEAGADILELGVPFSDPMADGVRITQAYGEVLAGGFRVEQVFDVVREFRSEGHVAPIVLMGYANLWWSMGLDAAALATRESGAQGLIVPDLPPEESAPVRAALDAHDLGLVMLVAPTCSDARIARIEASASAYLYAVTVTGITGERSALADTIPAYLDRVRAHVAPSTHIVAGFGLRSAEQVRALAPHVDGVVVGSALLALGDLDQQSALLRSMRTALSADERR